MRVTWLGHGGFRIEAGGATLLVDPWLRGNPSFDEARLDDAIAGATHILLTHAHGDHSADVAEIATKAKAPALGVFDLTQWLASAHGIETVGFNIGGAVKCADAEVTMVGAMHSSTLPPAAGTAAVGREVGYMISDGTRTLYFMGDTDVHANMGLYQDLHRPDLGILPIGGHFTMDARRAAYACKKFFDFEAVIPCHYATFPLLAPSADGFVREMEGEKTRVIVPEVMAPIDL